MKILLIEDDIIWQSEFLMQLNSIGFSEIEICEDLEEAVKYLHVNTPSLIIADIMLKGNSVFELFEKMPQVKDMLFLFITISDKKSFYELSKNIPNSYFLAKTVNSLGMLSSIDKIINDHPALLNCESKKGITVRGQYLEKIFIEIDKIIYIKSELAYCIIKTINSQFALKGSLQKISENLYPEIIQIQRGYAVNKKFISKIELSKMYVAVNAEKLPIGRQFKKSMINYLNEIRKI